MEKSILLLIMKRRVLTLKYRVDILLKPRMEEFAWRFNACVQILQNLAIYFTKFDTFYQRRS